MFIFLSLLVFAVLCLFSCAFLHKSTIISFKKATACHLSRQERFNLVENDVAEYFPSVMNNQSAYSKAIMLLLDKECEREKEKEIGEMQLHIQKSFFLKQICFMVQRYLYYSSSSSFDWFLFQIIFRKVFYWSCSLVSWR